MNVQKVLQRARKLVEKGWIRGASKRSCDDGGYCYCTTGAVNEITNGSGALYEGALFTLAKVIRPVKKRVYTSTFAWNNATIPIQSWNDKGHRRKKDILKAFDRAIAKAKKEKL